MAAPPTVGHEGFAVIVARHVARYPAMQPSDVYELAHQACLGSEHAVPDRAQAQRWLERELAELRDGLPEPTLDPVSPDGRILRVHLRSFLAGGGDTVRLLDAFVRTAGGFRGSTAQLRSWWSSVEEMAAGGLLPFAHADSQALGRRMEAVGYPAVHHPPRTRSPTARRTASWRASSCRSHLQLRRRHFGSVAHAPRPPARSGRHPPGGT